MRQKLGSSILISFALICCAFGVNYWVNVILTNSIGAKLFGEYSIVVYTVQFFGVIALAGFDYNIMKFLPGYIIKNDWASASGLILYTRKILMRIHPILLVFTFIVGGVFYWYDIHWLSVDYPEYYVILAFIWIIPFCSMVVLRGKVLRSLGFTILSVFIMSLLSPLLMLIALGLVHYFGYSLSLFELIFIYFFIVVLIVRLEKYIVRSKANPAMFSAPRIFHKKTWKENAFKLLATNFFTLSVQSITLIISRCVDPNKNNVGILAVIFTICTLFDLAYNAINVTVSPRMSEALKKKDMNAVKHMINASKKFAFIIGGSFLLLLIFYGQTLLGHFSSSFKSALLPLVIIAFSYFLSLAFEMYNRFLQYANHIDKVFLFVVGGTLIGYAIISILLTKFYGLLGTAIAFSSAGGLLSAFYAIKSQRILYSLD